MKEASTLLKTLCSIKDAEVAPPDKYELSKTSAQDYGWVSKPLVDKNPMFGSARQSCEITKYADAYYEMSGTTPFSRKDVG